MPTEAVGSALIDTIYGAVLQPELWRKFLEDFATAIDADGGLIHAPPIRNAMPIPFLTHNIDPTPVLDKMAKYGRQAPFAERAVQRGLAPGVFTNFDMIPPKELFETEYFREYMTPTRTGDAVQVLVRLPEPETPALGVTVGRLIDRPAFNEDDVAFGWRLFPHVRRAAQLALEINARAGVDASIAQAFDGFATPCIVLNPRGQTLVVNAAAKTLLDARDGVEYAGSAVRACDAAAQARLEEAISHATGLSWGLRPRTGAEIVLPRKNGRESLLAVLLPLGDDNPFTGIVGAARAAIYILDAGLSDTRLAGLRRAQKLFGLTPAEEDILKRFVAGSTLEEIAAARGVELSTVRTQFKALLDKTQSRRQSDLGRFRALTEAGV